MSGTLLDSALGPPGENRDRDRRNQRLGPAPLPKVVKLAQLADFDEIIDVRSPSEYREDHIPGALNLPVLDDEERARVGTIYVKESAFAAKKIGAALVSRNIARHLDAHLSGKPRNWRPLVYCWRGGSRSGSMAHILDQVGWRPAQLEGGYKAYRRAVLDQLATLPARYRFRAVCGPTGSGKSRLLRALAQQGAQVLDLEDLAAHRGSVLGDLPDAPQPSQKMFDSRVWWQLRQFDPSRPVYVEAESKKIGNVRVADALIAAMWQGDCVRLELETASRVRLLKEEYTHFLENPATLNDKLDCLVGLHGRDLIRQWKDMAQAGQWDELVAELLARHYDPTYLKSTLKHYPRYHEAVILEAAGFDEPEMARLARALEA